MPDANGRWLPGESGNPNGRKKGECEKHRLYKQIVEPRVPELVQQAINIALSDDRDRSKVLSIFLERALPAILRDNILKPGVELCEGTLLEQANHVRDLITDKHITPEQGQILLANIKTTADIKYKDDLEKEVEDLKIQIKTLKDKVQ